MVEKARRAVNDPPPTVCSLCGKSFGFWDAVQDFTLDDSIGYGSRYDLCRLHLHLCCNCLDRLLDWLIPQCAHNPIEEFDENNNNESENKKWIKHL